MGFKTHFADNKVIVTFNKELQESDIKDAFLYVVENADVKKLKHIIFDYSYIDSYTIPDDYLSRVKIFTKFSQTWNPNINAITVGTNKNIQFVTNEIIKKSNQLDLLWNYMLFDNLNTALEWCENN